MTNEVLIDRLTQIRNTNYPPSGQEFAVFTEAVAIIRRVAELERERNSLLTGDIGMAYHCGEEKIISLLGAANDRAKRYRADRDAARAEVAGLREALSGLVAYANKTFDYWDSDQDSKVGKRLKFMSGDLPGYEPKLKYHEALSSTAATAEAYKRRVQSEVLEEFYKHCDQPVGGFGDYQGGAEFQRDAILRELEFRIAALREGR